MNGQHSVLVVDRSEESREVLQTVLERRGVRTMTASKADAGVQLAKRHHPELIVLDLESVGDGIAPLCRAGILPSSDETEATAPASQPDYQPQLVLLGSLRGWRDRVPGGEFVAKPYHYGPLIRKIEELLEAKPRPNTSVPTKLGQGPCRRYSSSVAPIREAASN
ncbi:MAG: hypothetical protein ABFC63_10050 [Thermoguttaceae bacterium]